MGWTTRNPREAQNAVSGAYPSRFHPLPWENTTTGRLVPVAGADARTSSGTARPGLDKRMGATETTGAPAPVMPSSLSMIVEVVIVEVMQLLPS